MSGRGQDRVTQISIILHAVLNDLLPDGPIDPDVIIREVGCFVGNVALSLQGGDRSEMIEAISIEARTLIYASEAGATDSRPLASVRQ